MKNLNNAYHACRDDLDREIMNEIIENNIEINIRMLLEETQIEYDLLLLRLGRLEGKGSIIIYPYTADSVIQYHLDTVNTPGMKYCAICKQEISCDDSHMIVLQDCCICHNCIEKYDAWTDARKRERAQRAASTIAYYNQKQERREMMTNV